VKTYVASKNAGKLDELRAIFAGSPLEPDTYAEYASVPEVAPDYLGNARLKAEALAGRLASSGVGAAVLADDSGLEVDALDGRPGVYSARYAGADATWETRRRRLLDELQGVAPARRGSRFVCAMALILPDGEILTVLGTVAGTITEAPCGAGGFGYDPLFFHPPSGCTFAQLTPVQKNNVSHRRVAANALLAALAKRG
jgi:XTP/dITP diphosphohydrolase